MGNLVATFRSSNVTAIRITLNFKERRKKSFANERNQGWSLGMGFDNRKGAGPPTSYGNQSLPHVVAMVTIVAVFSVRHVPNQLSMDRPQQLSIRQKISMFLSPGVRLLG